MNPEDIALAGMSDDTRLADLFQEAERKRTKWVIRPRKVSFWLRDWGFGNWKGVNELGPISTTVLGCLAIEIQWRYKAKIRRKRDHNRINWAAVAAITLLVLVDGACFLSIIWAWRHFR